MSAHTYVLPEHAFPGNLTDMTSDEDKKTWSESYISGWMSSEIKGGGQGPHGIPRTPLSQFFDGTVTAYDNTQTPTPVTWTAYPKRISWLTTNTPLRWQIADSSRIYQDEYLEWSVYRTGKDAMDYTGNILSCSFTCEGPEYWQYLASQHPDAIAPLYKQLNPVAAGQMQDSDFFLSNGKADCYNPTNYWNFLTSSGSIAHLIHPSNTLSAEIDIAAQATVIRQDKDKNIITDETQLINCSQYGNPYRNSDPHIGSMINTAARNNLSLTVAEPVALYMYSFNTSSFMLDQTGLQDASQTDLVAIPDGISNFTRGDITKNQGLRLDISVPSTLIGTKTNKPLTVSDIYDTNNEGYYVKCAAQFTDYILMSVSAYTLPTTDAPAQYCPGQDPNAKKKPHVSALLAAHGLKSSPSYSFTGRRAA